MKNVSESLLAKLKNASKANGIAMPTAMRRYSYERMLSLMKDVGIDQGFSLKGGMLIAAMFQGRRLRPTEDLDLNGRKGLSLRDMEDVIRTMCAAHDGSDGLLFDAASLKIIKNRDDNFIKGGSIAVNALIGKARVPLKIDAGYGNTITPCTSPILLPTLLPSIIAPFEFPAYPVETVISEKLHASYKHGLLNSRIKDYFDIFHLSRTYELDGQTLAEAILATFSTFDDEVPLEFAALTQTYAQQPGMEKQWHAFLKEAQAEDGSSFKDVVQAVNDFTRPILETAVNGAAAMQWSPVDGWQPGVSHRL